MIFENHASKTTRPADGRTAQDAATDADRAGEKDRLLGGVHQSGRARRERAVGCRVGEVCQSVPGRGRRLAPVRAKETPPQGTPSEAFVALLWRVVSFFINSAARKLSAATSAISSTCMHR